MKKMIFALLVVGLFLCVSAVSFAKPPKKPPQHQPNAIQHQHQMQQHPQHNNPNARVNSGWENQADKNNDGVVNPKEYKHQSHTGPVDTPAEKDIDANKDGKIDDVEIEHAKEN